MRYLVLGSGLMGRAAAFDLLRHDDTKELILVDIDESNLKSVGDFLDDSRVKTVILDAKDKTQVLDVMEGIDSVVACISYTLNYDLTKTAIKSGANFCDLGGNNTVVAKQFTLSEEAEKANVTIIPDCGLAPGVASIFVENGASKLDTVEEIHIRVGGLPQNPKPPLNYSLIFSVQGLTNEYIEIAEVIRDGKLTKVEPLTEIEEIEFPEPFGKLEAFQTTFTT